MPAMHRNRVAPFVLVALFVLPALAADPAYTIEVAADRPDALYQSGERITFRLQLKDGDKPVVGQRLMYKLSKDGIAALGEGSVETGAEPATVQASLSEPGFVRCDVTFNARATRPITATAGAGIEPLKIKGSLPVPDDFDAFWAKQRAIVQGEPIKPVLTPVESPDGSIETFDVQIAGPAPGNNVSGYLARPKGATAKSLPAILYPHSAGVRDSDLKHAVRGARLNAITFDFNAHGLPNGKGEAFYKAQYPDGPFKGYSSRGMNDRDQMYFRGMYMRLMRALDFLTTLPEWDGKILIVEGSSQGGGQALVAAGLDPRVTLGLASVPAMCDHTGLVANQAAGWPRMLKLDADGKTDPAATQVVRYFDAMNFATRIKCPTIVSVGFIDKTCPPTSVFAAYNNIPAGVDKKIVMRVDMGHAFPADLISEWDKVVKDHVASMRQTTTSAPTK
jgi:cephalosporin-C deacetylase-like acetyl esterase